MATVELPFLRWCLLGTLMEGQFHRRKLTLLPVPHAGKRVTSVILKNRGFRGKRQQQCRCAWSWMCSKLETATRLVVCCCPLLSKSCKYIKESRWSIPSGGTLLLLLFRMQHMAAGCIIFWKHGCADDATSSHRLHTKQQQGVSYLFESKISQYLSELNSEASYTWISWASLSSYANHT